MLASREKELEKRSRERVNRIVKRYDRNLSASAESRKRVCAFVLIGNSCGSPKPRSSFYYSGHVQTVGGTLFARFIGLY
jgi:hypothetical protein